MVTTTSATVIQNIILGILFIIANLNITAEALLGVQVYILLTRWFRITLYRLPPPFDGASSAAAADKGVKGIALWYYWISTETLAITSCKTSLGNLQITFARPGENMEEILEQANWISGEIDKIYVKCEKNLNVLADSIASYGSWDEFVSEHKVRP